MTNKTCGHCRRLLPTSAFHRTTWTTSGFTCWCKSCTSEWQREYYLTHKDIFAARTKRYREGNRSKIQATIRRRKFKITQADYDEMFRLQDGKCAICGRLERYILPNGKRRDLALDHDHDTGRVRGLLCALCNRGLGMFDDSLERLREAVAYLERGNIIA